MSEEKVETARAAAEPAATSPMVPSATRADDDYGRASHTDRINPDDNAPPGVPAPGAIVWTDANGKPWTGAMLAAALNVERHAHEDHPDGVRWPYATMQPSFFDHVLRPAGALLWLLPHEVAAHHRIVSPEVFKSLGVKNTADQTGPSQAPVEPHHDDHAPPVAANDEPRRHDE